MVCVCVYMFVKLSVHMHFAMRRGSQSRVQVPDAVEPY